MKIIIAHQDLSNYIPSATYSAELEVQTGADILLSISPMPCLPVTWVKHLESRQAKLIQLKVGHDFTNSIEDGRLMSQMERMQSCARVHPAQRTLLIAGEIHLTDKWTIDGVEGLPFAQMQGALDKWQARGGSVSFISHQSKLNAWLEQQAKHLLEFKAQPVKLLLDKPTYPAQPPADVPEDDPAYDPLQLLRAVNDARKLLISLPDTGVMTVEYLWRVTDGNAMQALHLATHPTDWKLLDNRPRSIGQKWIERNRAFLGLKDGQLLDTFFIKGDSECAYDVRCEQCIHPQCKNYIPF